MIKIQITEEYTTIVTREAIVLDQERYPELKEVPQNELHQYIEEHMYDMVPIDNTYSNLYEELLEQDIITDKIIEGEPIIGVIELEH